MRPVLYPSDEVYYVYLGKGKIADVISCVVYEELNGEWSLTMEYPVTGPMLADLYAGGTIGVYAPSYGALGNDITAQEFFDIYKHSVPINGVVTFYANHISRRLANCVYYGSTLGPNGSILTYSSPNAQNINNIKFTKTVSTVSGTDVASIPDTAIAKLIGSEQSVHSVWGADVIFYSYTPVDPYNPDTTWVPTCTLYVVNQRGHDNGVTIRFGVDLTDMEYTQDSSGTYNALVPYWQKPNGTYKFTTNYLVQPTTPVTPVIAAPYDCSNDFETEPTSAEMETLAQEILDNNTPWISAETIEADFLNGAEVDPHGARIQLGDLVTVYWPEAQVKKKMRVVSYEYDTLGEQYLKMTLGTQDDEFVLTSGDNIVSSSASGGNSAIQYTIEEKYVDNVTVNANSYAEIDINVAKTGYTAVGLLGYAVNLASSNGTNASRCFVYDYHVVDATSAFVQVRNTYTSAAKIKVRVFVLYQES